MVRASRSVKNQSPLPPIDVEALQIRLGGRSLSGNNYGAERKQAAFRERAGVVQIVSDEVFCWLPTMSGQQRRPAATNCYPKHMMF